MSGGRFDDRPGFHSEIKWVNGPGARDGLDPVVRRRARAVAARVVLARWCGARPGSVQWTGARGDLREVLRALGLGEEAPGAGPGQLRIPGQGC